MILPFFGAVSNVVSDTKITREYMTVIEIK